MKNRELETLTSAELDNISGGWCGTPWPGQFGGLVPPPPEPDPWYMTAIQVSRFDMVALNPQPLPPKSSMLF